MRSFFLAAMASATLLIGATVLSEPSPDSDCTIRKNGIPTTDYIKWNQFFSKIHEYSEKNGCSVGKISYTSESGRMYIDGRKVGTDLSNREIQDYKFSYGYNDYSCPTFTCDETEHTSSQPPKDNSGHESNNECIQKVLLHGNSRYAAINICDELNSNPELQCVDALLDYGYSVASLRSTCQSVSDFEITCIRKSLQNGYSPHSAKNYCKK